MDKFLVKISRSERNLNGDYSFDEEYFNVIEEDSDTEDVEILEAPSMNDFDKTIVKVVINIEEVENAEEYKEYIFTKNGFNGDRFLPIVVLVNDRPGGIEYMWDTL